MLFPFLFEESAGFVHIHEANARIPRGIFKNVNWQFVRVESPLTVTHIHTHTRTWEKRDRKKNEDIKR